MKNRVGLIQKLVKVTILGFCLVTSFAFAEENQSYAIRTAIFVQNQETGQTITIEPESGVRLRIVDEINGGYRLELINSNGSTRSGRWITARGNIDNNIIYPQVLSDFEQAISAIEEAGEPPVCHDCEESNRVAAAEIVGNCDIPGTNDQWKQRCQELFDSDIPQEALEYTLRAMKLNATSFRTNQCWDTNGIKHAGHPSMMGLTGDEFENNLMANGLANKCQFIINDTDDRSPSPRGDDCRGQMYFIDLCGDGELVTKDYFNLGTGTCRGGRNGFRNGRGLNTTVKGVFFTHNQTFDFRDTTRQQSHYAAVQDRVQDAGGPHQATAIHLFGLQNTNNLASKTGKYMHVSPHRSSHGCPSILPENYYMIEALANGGPSMVVNWGREGMEDLEQCTE